MENITFAKLKQHFVELQQSQKADILALVGRPTQYKLMSVIAAIEGYCPNVYELKNFSLSLPPELVRYILSFLHPSSILVFAHTNHYHHAFIYNNAFWLLYLSNISQMQRLLLATEAAASHSKGGFILFRNVKCDERTLRLGYYFFSIAKIYVGTDYVSKEWNSYHRYSGHLPSIKSIQRAVVALDNLIKLILNHRDVAQKAILRAGVAHSQALLSQGIEFLSININSLWKSHASVLNASSDFLLYYLRKTCKNISCWLDYEPFINKRLATLKNALLAFVTKEEILSHNISPVSPLWRRLSEDTVINIINSDIIRRRSGVLMLYSHGRDNGPICYRSSTLWNNDIQYVLPSVRSLMLEGCYTVLYPDFAFGLIIKENNNDEITKRLLINARRDGYTHWANEYEILCKISTNNT